jgi:hypothetical protein
MERAGHVTHIEKLKNAYQILVRKPGGKRLLAGCRNGIIILKWISNSM